MPRKFNKKLIKPSELYKAYDYSLYLLDRQMYASGQLRLKLIQKGYTEAEANETVERLLKNHFLNDEQYIQVYSENLKKYKLVGYYGLKKKLGERRLPSDLIEQVLNEFSMKEELQIAREFVKKSGSRKSKEQLARALQSRGFRMDVIYKIVRGLDAVAEPLADEE